MFDEVITDRLFAHINNDHELSGNSFQYEEPTNVARYIVNFIEHLADQEIDFPGLPPEQRGHYLRVLTPLQQDLQSLIASYDPTKFAENLRQAVGTIGIDTVALANELHRRGRVLLNGGWVDITGYLKHHIPVELFFENNYLIVVLHNAGSGLEYHLKVQNPSGDLFATAKVFKIPQNELLDPKQVQYLIQKLTEPLMLPLINQDAHKFDAAKFYQHILAVMIYFDANEIDPLPFCNNYRKPQRSSVVAWKSLSTYLQNKIKTDPDVSFELIKFEFKLYSIIDYFKQLKTDERLQNAAVGRNLDFALENLMRAVKKLSVAEPGLPLERQILATEYYNKITTQLAAARAIPAAALDRIKFLAPDTRVPYVIGVSTTTGVVNLQSYNLPNFSLPWSHLPQIGNQPHTEIPQCLAKLLDLCADDAIAAAYKVVTIEKTMLGIEFSYWQQLLELDTLTKVAIIVQLADLSFLYNKYFISNGTPITTENYVLRFALSTLAKMLLCTMLDMHSRATEYWLKDEQFFAPDGISLQPLLERHRVLLRHLRNFKSAIHRAWPDDYDAKRQEILSYEKENITWKNFYRQIARKKDPYTAIYDALVAMRQLHCLERVDRFGNGTTADLFLPTIEQRRAWMAPERLLAALYGRFIGNNIDTWKLRFEIDRRVKLAFTFSDMKNAIYKNSTQLRYQTTPLKLVTLDNDSNDQLGRLEYDPIHLARQNIRTVLNRYGGASYKNNRLYLIECVAEERHHYAALLLAVLSNNYSIAVTSTLEFLHLHQDDLHSVCMQDEMLETLLFNDVLKNQLNRYPLAVHQFVDNMQQLFDYFYEDGYPKPPAFFMLRLGVLMHKYFHSLLDPSLALGLDIEVHALLQKLRKLLNQIPTSMATIAARTPLSDFDQDRLVLFNLYNILRIRNEFLETGTLSLDAAKELLVSNYSRKENELNNSSLKYRDRLLEQECLEAMCLLTPQLQILLSEQQDAILNYVLTAITGQQFKAALVWRGSYPLFNTECDATFFNLDLFNGKIYRQNNKLYKVPLPARIFNCEGFLRFFGKARLNGYVSTDQTKAEFVYRGITYRYNARAHAIQAELAVSGYLRWFEYKPIYKYLPSSDKILAKHPEQYALPHTILDSNHEIWVPIDRSFWFPSFIHSWMQPEELNHVIFDKKTKRALYKVSTTSVTRINSDPHDPTLEKLLDLHSDQTLGILAILEKFESRDYMECWEHRNLITNTVLKYTIKLPRYRITFVILAADLNAIIWEQDQRYKLQLNPSYAYIDNFYNYLELTPIDLSCNLSNKILVPQQSFLCGDPSLDCAAPQLINAGYSRLYLNTHNGFQPEPPHNYDLSKLQQYSEFNVAAKKIYPRNVTERLHLAYIYFACDQTQRAFDTLLGSISTFSGKPSEMHFLNAIITGPEWYSATTGARHRDGASYTAVRALAIYIKIHKHQLMRGNDLDYANAKIGDSELRLNITTIYRYFDSVNNIPDTIRLNAAQEHTLLVLYTDVYRKNKEYLPPKMAAIFTQRTAAMLQQLLGNLNIQQQTLQQYFTAESNELLQKVQEALAQVDRSITERYSAIAEQQQIIDLDLDLEFLSTFKTNDIIQYWFLSAFKHTAIIRPFIDWQHWNLDLDNAVRILAAWSERALDIPVRDNDALKQQLADKVLKFLKICYHDPALHARSDFKRIKTPLILLHYALKYPQMAPHIAFEKFHYVDQPNEGDRQRIHIMKYVDKIHREMDNNLLAFTNISAQQHIIAEVTTELAIQPLAATAKPFTVQDLSSAMGYGSIPEGLQRLLTNAGLETFIKSYRAIELAETCSITTNKLQPLVLQRSYSNEAGINKNLTAIQQDYEHGVRLNNLQYELDQFAILTLNNDTILTRIAGSLAQELKELNDHVAYLADAVNRYANQNDPDITTKLELAGRQKHRLDLAEIITLFIRRDPAIYQSQAATNENYLLSLHKHIFMYLLASTQLQHYQRCYKLAQNALAATDLLLKPIMLADLGKLLTAQRSYDPCLHPEMLAFESLTDKLLYPVQTKFLDLLMHKPQHKYCNSVLQLIMGGGKTKVLLPNLAYKRVNGANLVIVMVSRAMFETNLADLTVASSAAFKQNAIGFTFNRRNETDQNAFRDILRLFITTMNNRDYLVSTPESMQSLELKYIEILAMKALEDPNWVAMLRSLELILSILRSQADIIIDEVDQNLDYRFELNYSLGEKISIQRTYPFLIQDTLRLYQELAQHVDLIGILASKQATPTAQQWDSVINKLSDHLLEDKNSSLHDILQTTPVDPKELKNYLLARCEHKPVAVSLMMADQQDRLALLKEQLSKALLATLSRNRNEHYGLPKQRPTLLKRHIAVPYIGANTPSDQSDFANVVGIVNYTIQSHLGVPPTRELFKHILQHFVDQYVVLHQKYFVDTLARDKLHALRAEFTYVTGLDIKLQLIELEDMQQFTSLYDKACVSVNLPQLIRLNLYILASHVLPGVETHSHKLTANPYTLLSQFNTVIGVSGTLQNLPTLTPRLQANYAFSHGTDGQTIDNLLQHTLSVQSLDTDTTADQLIDKHAQRNRIYALIDLGAYCKDYTNLQIAQQLHAVFHRTNIKYILFFNAHNILSALPTGELLTNTKLIEIGSSEQAIIQQSLNCSPNQYFTYYDQLHITGADIRQADDAHALVTLGNLTPKRDLLQAVMRMRQLSQGQRLHFIVPAKVREQFDDIKIWDIATILDFTIANETQQLATQNYQAALQKMQEVLRNHVLQNILDETNNTRKIILLDKFKEYFVAQVNSSMTQLYGNIHASQPTQQLLTEIANKLFVAWEQACKLAAVDISKIRASIITKFNDIVNDALPNCLKNTSGSAENLDTTMVQEAEVAMQIENEEPNEEQLQRPVDKVAMIETNIHLPNAGWSEWFELLRNSVLMSFEQFKQTSAVQTNWSFADKLFCTTNFAYTYVGQENLFLCKKTSFHIMVIQNPNSAVMDDNIYIVLTPKDTELLSNAIDYYKNDQQKLEGMQLWIQTPHGAYHNATTTIAPLAKSKTHHDDMMQQISYLNGDLGLLLNYIARPSWPEPFNWLAQDCLSKIHFLQHFIMPNHRNKEAYLKPVIEQLIFKRLLRTEAASEHNLGLPGYNMFLTRSKIGSEAREQKFRDRLFELLDKSFAEELINILDSPLDKVLFFDPITTEAGHTYSRREFMHYVNSQCSKTGVMSDWVKDPIANIYIRTQVRSNKALADFLVYIMSNKFTTIFDFPGFKDSKNNFFKNPYLNSSGTLYELDAFKDYGGATKSKDYKVAEIIDLLRTQQAKLTAVTEVCKPGLTG